jgi:hypothetical protein
MDRVHLFELEDQPWFPSLIRDAGTAYLRFAIELTGQARMLAPKLREALEASGRPPIVDLCSGGSGPVPSVIEVLAEEGFETRALLTDKFPNQAAFDHVREASAGRVDCSAESVDASAVPAEMKGLRTLFSALHHFRPASARGILQSAVDSGQPIAAFEVVSRHPAAILSILLSPIAVLLSVPFLRPFHWSWLPLTYVVPIIPFFVMWDGLVSCFRVYSPRELKTMIASLDGGDRFDWDVGNIALSPAPFPATYCVGTPRSDQ